MSLLEKTGSYGLLEGCYYSALRGYAKRREGIRRDMLHCCSVGRGAWWSGRMGSGGVGSGGVGSGGVESGDW